MPDKEAKGCCGVPTFAVLILAAVSAVFALLLANYLYIGWGCNRSKALFDTEVRWDGSERISIAEKNVTVIRALSKERCYVLPNNLSDKANNEVSVVRKIDEAELHALAGDDAVLFCKGDDTYLLSTASEEPRRWKRANPGHVLRVSDTPSYPECRDTVLNCEHEALGEVHKCETKQATLLSSMKGTPRMTAVRHQRSVVCERRLLSGLGC